MRLLTSVRRSVAGIVALASVALLIAACGSSSTATDATNVGGSSSQAAGPTTGAVSGGTHEFTATLSVTGAVTKSASFTESISGRPACAAFAQAGIPGTGANSKLWYLPNNPDYTFLMTWDVMTYTGPGTYTGSAANSANLAAGGQQFVALTATSSTLSVTVNADGSGSATFSNLQNQATKAAVSGTETWTCS